MIKLPPNQKSSVKQNFTKQSPDKFSPKLKKSHESRTKYYNHKPRVTLKTLNPSESSEYQTENSDKKARRWFAIDHDKDQKIHGSKVEPFISTKLSFTKHKIVSHSPRQTINIISDNNNHHDTVMNHPGDLYTSVKFDDSGKKLAIFSKPLNSKPTRRKQRKIKRLQNSVLKNTWNMCVDNGAHDGVYAYTVCDIATLTGEKLHDHELLLSNSDKKPIIIPDPTCDSPRVYNHVLINNHETPKTDRSKVFPCGINTIPFNKNEENDTNQSDDYDTIKRQITDSIPNLDVVSLNRYLKTPRPRDKPRKQQPCKRDLRCFSEPRSRIYRNTVNSNDNNSIRSRRKLFKEAHPRRRSRTTQFVVQNCIFGNQKENVDSARRRKSKLLNEKTIGQFILRFDKNLQRRNRRLGLLKNILEHLEPYLSDCPTYEIIDSEIHVMDDVLHKFDISIQFNLARLRFATLELVESLKIVYNTLVDYFDSVKRMIDLESESSEKSIYSKSIKLRFKNTENLENLIAKCEMFIKLMNNDTAFIMKMPYVMAYLHLPNAEGNPFFLNEINLRHVLPRFDQTGMF